MHRDVKPANVLLSGEHAYLADFGLTRFAGADTHLTTAGHFLGTVDYMAPEQFHPGPNDARADVYALGCVLFAALTGAPPFLRETVPATMLAHLHDPPPRRVATRAACRASFDRVLARALAKAPEDRYPSAGDFGRAALAAAEGRSVTEEERSVARGAAAPTIRRDGAAVVGRSSAAAGPASPRAGRAGADPHLPRAPAAPRCGRGRPASSRSPAARARRSRSSPAATARPPPGEPVSEAEVTAARELVRLRLRRRGRGAASSRLLTSDAQRVSPTEPPARPRRRSSTAYESQFARNRTTGFELSRPRGRGRPVGRATARYRARYEGEPRHDRAR